MMLDTILTPAEFTTLATRDLRETACVVFDVLRATSTFVTALHHGAQAIIPVAEITEAIALHRRQPEVLLGGERNGVRISADGVVFDLGNSPREFMPEKVRGKTIVSTTTNGTRALRACANAQTVLAASFLNLSATAEFLQRNQFKIVLLVCAGTGEKTALEDVLGAGALGDLLAGSARVVAAWSDATQVALRAYQQAKPNLTEVLNSSENARRLLAIPELRADVAFCQQRDAFPLVAQMGAGGAIRKV